MSSTYGKVLKVSVFGQSHSKGIGVVIDGIPAGEKIDFEKLQQFLNRRAPGNSSFATARKEADAPEFLSGLIAPSKAPMIINPMQHTEAIETIF